MGTGEDIYGVALLILALLAHFERSYWRSHSLITTVLSGTKVPSHDPEASIAEAASPKKRMDI